MTNDNDSIRLLDRWKSGDESAADEIFQRYVHRLARLAHGRLSERMKQRVDPEDIVQSAYRSFFRHAKSDRYELKKSGDLWRLLAAITVNKVMGQVEFHKAAKRSVDVEGSLDADAHQVQVSPVVLTREPTILEAVALADEVEALMRTLDPTERKVFELRLQDYSTEEIASEVSRSTRTIRRILNRIKEALASRFGDDVVPPDRE